MRRILLVLGAVLTALAAQAKVECVCVYYPHWHRYAKGDAWFGAERWKAGEWCFVKDAKRRFEGQKQPLLPFAGFLDESNPKDMEKDIALAANAGIDVFLYDYYYYGGEITQEDALEKGFLGAANRNRMKFALMWCYHERNDQFRPELGAERRRLMSLAHTKEEFLGLIDLSIKRYFPRPEYWRKDGRLFFSIYNFRTFYQRHGGSPEKIRAEIEEARARVRAAGLGELHVNAQEVRPDLLDAVAACGVDSITSYNNNIGVMPPGEMYDLRKAGVWEVDYAACVPHVYRRWETLAKGPLPYIPQVTTGWDSTPRCRLDESYPWRKEEYPYTMSFRNNTPEVFREMLAAAKARVENDPKKPGAVYINGWNEYTEGTYLVPNNFDSDGFLRAIASVFGRDPANEYTYVDPGTRELLTIPAPTHENVAYGPGQWNRLDVWLPKGASAPVPLRVFMPSAKGAPRVDKAAGLQVAPLLARGVAVACVDGPDALAFIQKQAKAWNVDPARIDRVSH